MKYEQSVKDLYKIAGMLEMLACMEGQNISHCMTLEIEDAVDKLELIGTELINRDYGSLIDKYDSLINKHACLLKEYDELRLKMEVNAHEGTEEPPPIPQPADQ